MEIQTEVIQKIKMPPGRYWVGDLCYVLREEWDEVCGLFFKGRTDHGANEGGFTLADGRNFVCFNTAWGDGEYYDNFGNSYGVDAGCIGLIAVEPGFECDGGNVHLFKYPFECRKEGRGTLIFNNIIIETDA